MTRFGFLLLARGILALIVGCVLIVTIAVTQSADGRAKKSTEPTVSVASAQALAPQYKIPSSNVISVLARAGEETSIHVRQSGASTGATVQTNPIDVRPHTEYSVSMNADVRPATHGPGNPAAYVFGTVDSMPREQLAGYGYVVGAPPERTQSFAFSTGKWSRIIFIPVALNSWSWRGGEFSFWHFRITPANCQPAQTVKTLPLGFAGEARLIAAFLLLDGVLAGWLAWQLPAFGRRRLAGTLTGLSIAFGLALAVVPELHVSALYPLVTAIVLTVLGVRHIATTSSPDISARLPKLVIQSAIASVAFGVAYFSLSTAVLASFLGFAGLRIAKLVRRHSNANSVSLRAALSHDSVLAAMLTILPLLPLFNPFGYLREDWNTGTWLSGFYGAYLLHHGWFPNEINAVVSGDVTPLFYGFTLFRLTGLWSTMFHGDVALRLAVIGATFAATYEAVSLLRSLTKSQIFVASLVLAAIPTNYALTNLYARGASNEFCSTMLVLAAICCWLKFGFGGGPWDRPFRTGLYFSVAAGSHPITAAGGSMLFALAALTTLLLGRTPRWQQGLSLCGLAVITLAIISPWLYVVAHFSSDLAVAQGPPMIAFTDFDKLAVRFWPLPLDPRPSSPTLSSPGFTAQIAVYLVLNLALIGTFTHERRLNWRVALVVALQVLFATSAFVLSVMPAAWHVAPRITHPLFLFQSVYRLLTYFNGAVFLLCVTALASARAPVGFGKVGRAAAVAIFALVVVNLGVRLTMGAQSIAHQTAPPGVALFDAADRVLGFQTNVPSDYSTPRLYRDVQLAVRDGRVLFMPGTAGEAWGVAQPLICMSLPSNAPMTTNLIPFPWNAVTINAHEVTDAKFVHDDRQNANFVVIKAKVGVNRFEYLFRPDRTWVVLSGFSFLAMLAVIPLSLRGFLIGDPQQPTRREEPLAD